MSALVLTKSWQTVAKYTYNHSSGARCDFYIESKYTEQEISNNLTKVDVRLRSDLGTGHVLGGSNYKFTCSFCPEVKSTTGTWYFGDEVITSISEYKLSHDSDGKKSATLSASVFNGYLGINFSFSGEITLPTIPRESTAYTGSANIEEITTIIIQKADDSFKHTLKYRVNNSSGIIVDKTLEKSYPWKIPTSFYNLIPNDTSIGYTIICETYDSNNNYIGTVETSAIAYVNQTANKPEIIVTSYYVDNSSLPSGGGSFGLLKELSKLVITYEIKAKNGASISIKTINGKTLTASPYYLNGIQSAIQTIIAVDSRGISSTYYLDMSSEFINYVPLTLSAVVSRPVSTSGEAVIEFSGNYFNGDLLIPSTNTILTRAVPVNNFNELTIRVGYKKTTDTNYTMISEPLTFILNGNTYHSSNGGVAGEIVLGTDFDYQSKYDIIIYYWDKTKFVSSTTYLPVSSYQIKTLSKGEPIINWDETKFNSNKEIQFQNKKLCYDENGEVVVASDKFVLSNGNVVLGFVKVDEW